MRVKYVDCKEMMLDVSSRLQFRRTLRILSNIASSDEAASLRIERKDAIRMLSAPLDQKSRHF